MFSWLDKKRAFICQQWQDFLFSPLINKWSFTSHRCRALSYSDVQQNVAIEKLPHLRQTYLCRTAHWWPWRHPSVLPSFYPQMVDEEKTSGAENHSLLIGPDLLNASNRLGSDRCKISASFTHQHMSFIHSHTYTVDKLIDRPKRTEAENRKRTKSRIEALSSLAKTDPSSNLTSDRVPNAWQDYLHEDSPSDWVRNAYLSLLSPPLLVSLFFVSQRFALSIYTPAWTCQLRAAQGMSMPPPPPLENSEPGREKELSLTKVNITAFVRKK